MLAFKETKFGHERALQRRAHVIQTPMIKTKVHLNCLARRLQMTDEKWVAKTQQCLLRRLCSQFYIADVSYVRRVF
jgi:hypothetical protein